MRIAPKPQPGQEMSLEQVLEERPEKPIEEIVDLPITSTSAANAPSLIPRPPFAVRYVDHKKGITRLEHVRVCDGQGGMSCPTIEIYERPILVKNYLRFLKLETSGVDNPHTIRPWELRPWDWLKTLIGWKLPTGFRPACAPTVYGIIRSLVKEGKVGDIYERNLRRIFPPEVLGTGIYTGTWIVPQDNSGVDYAHHPDCAIDQNNSTDIDFTRPIIPSQATPKTTILYPGVTNISQAQFGKDCQAIIGSQDWGEFYSIFRKMFHRNPHFRLLTQFYKKEVGPFLPLDRLPVILCADSRTINDEFFGLDGVPDRAYVYAIRVVKP